MFSDTCYRLCVNDLNQKQKINKVPCLLLMFLTKPFYSESTSLRRRNYEYTAIDGSYSIYFYFIG